MYKSIVLALIPSLFLIGCDAEIGKMQSLGKGAKITCYSGGKVIYSGSSTGKVLSEQASDGYYFKDSKDGKLKEVSGNCIITYGDK